MIAMIPPTTSIRLSVLKKWKTDDELPLSEYFKWTPAEKPTLRALNIAKVTIDSLSDLRQKLEKDLHVFFVE